MIAMEERKTPPKETARLHPPMQNPHNRIVADIMRRKEAEKRCEEIAAKIARRTNRAVDPRKQDGLLVWRGVPARCSRRSR